MFKALPRDSPSFGTAARAATCLYRNGDSSDTPVTAGALYAMYGDQAYVAPLFRFVDQWLNAFRPRGRVYVYVWDNYPGVPRGAGLGGMQHGDDVPYTFGVIDAKLRAGGAPADVNARETRLSHNFRTLLTSFAKSGNPNLSVAVPSDWPVWPPYDLTGQRYLAVSPSPVLSDHYRACYMALWNRLVPALVW
ncbi:hypothetical protein ACOMHN_020034 [Nucella lapillus]